MSKILARRFRVDFGDLGSAIIDWSCHRKAITTADEQGSNTTGGVFLPETMDPAEIIERSSNPEERDPHRADRARLSQVINYLSPDDWNDTAKTGLPADWSFAEIDAD